jgi:transposase
MQGRKTFTPKMLYSISLQELVAQNNFYRRLLSLIDFHWIYKQTASYYGSEGQESIDPVVFFKILLVGYINNIASDRKLIEFCSDSLAIRLFLGYDIDEPLPWHSTISRTRQLYGEKIFQQLPWHSTISRTRQLYGEKIFQQLFEKVFAKCVESGMVAGHTQAIDGALLKANASKDSLEIKKVDSSIDDYLLHQIKANTEPRRPAAINKAPEDQQHMQGDKNDQTRQLKELNTRYNRQAKQYEDMPADAEKGKFLSNKTHYSPTDPDARIAVKPGKPRELYYSGQIAVDTGKHVITHAQTVLAEGKDGDCLKTIFNKTKQRLEKHGLKIENALTDAGYSSGENYYFLDQQNITAYIPLLGGALSGSEGFIYDEDNDYYICPNNKILKGSGRIVDDGRGHPVRKYFSLKSDCDKCPLRSRCISTGAKTKKVQHSYYKPLLEAAKERALSTKGFRMRRKRSATAEPVWGTLINFTAMKRINTRGLSAANKCLILAATCYNLKKWMKHKLRYSDQKLQALTKEAARGLKQAVNTLLSLIEAHCHHLNITSGFN